MLISESKAGRYKQIQKNGRLRTTFLENVGKKPVILDIFPPNRAQIRSIRNNQEWKVDLQPVRPMNWASGRSLITRLTAIERANGICERCRDKPVHQVHHNRPLRGKSFLARVQSDRSQRETAIALCQECHLEAHQGSFRPKKILPNWNAGCAERCLSGVVSAS
jgi:hypothetical protein